MAAESCARSASDGAQADGQLQAPPSSLPSLSTGQLSPFPSQIASIASGRPLFPAPPSVPARFPAAGSISSRALGLPRASPLSRLGPHVWRPPHPIGRPGDAYGRLDDAFGARRTPYAVDQGEADAQVANRALSPRRRLSDALRTELLTKLYCLFRHTYDAVCCVYLLYFLHCWCIWFKECTAYLMSFFKSLIYEG